MLSRVKRGMLDGGLNLVSGVFAGGSFSQP